MYVASVKITILAPSKTEHKDSDAPGGSLVEDDDQDAKGQSDEPRGKQHRHRHIL